MRGSARDTEPVLGSEAAARLPDRGQPTELTRSTGSPSFSPHPDTHAQVTRLLETLRTKVSVVVGGDGSPTPLTDTLRLIV